MKKSAMQEPLTETFAFKSRSASPKTEALVICRNFLRRATITSSMYVLKEDSNSRKSNNKFATGLAIQKKIQLASANKTKSGDVIALPFETDVRPGMHRSPPSQTTKYENELHFAETVRTVIPPDKSRKYIDAADGA